MSGLFKRLSSRRSGGPEGTESPTAAEPGTTDAPTSTPAEPEGRQSLLTDPAAQTRVLRDGEQPAGLSSGDPLAPRPAASPHSAPEPAADPNAHTSYGAPADPSASRYGAPAPAADPNANEHYRAPEPAADQNAHTQHGTPAADPDAHTQYGTPAADPDAHTQHGAPAPAADANAHGQYAAPEPTADPHPYSRYGAEPVAAPAPMVDPNAPAPFAYQPPTYMPPIEPIADLPAGLDPDELGAAPGTSARRGKLRRRAAFLRAARELLLRDLGGFVYELHRTAHDIEHEAHRRLRETKLARLERVDAELHGLETRLDDVRRQVLVREPGVGGECPHCGELFGSAAHYCSHCGNPLTEAARRELAKAQTPAVAPVPEPAPEVAPQPVASVDQPTEEIPGLAPAQPGPEFQWPSRESWSAPTGHEAVAAEAPSDVTPVGEGDPAPSDAAADGETVPTSEGDAAPDAIAPRGDEVSAAVDTPVESSPGEQMAPAAAPSADADGTSDETAPQADEVPAAETPVGEGDPAPHDAATDGAVARAADGDAAPDDVTPQAGAAIGTPVGETTPHADEARAADEETPVAEDSTAPRADEAPAAGEEAPVAEDSTDEAPAADAEAPVAEDSTARHADEAAPADTDTSVGDGDPQSTAGDDDGAAPTDDAPAREYDTWRGQAANGHDDSILRPVERRP